MLTVAEAARELQRSRGRIIQLIASGRLRAEKHGRDWMIKPEDLMRLTLDWPRKAGRKRR
jgi:excisionase family DNA binding protein